MKPRGRFITFEGIDRCGKSTQSQELKRNLTRLGTRCLVTAEPGGSGDLGTTLRSILLDPNIERDEITSALLFNADRREHVHKVILPSLAKGMWVICDRFYDSTFAYQGAGGNVAMDLLAQLNQIVCGELKPDLTVLLCLDPEMRVKRSPKLDYYDRGRASYEKRIVKCFEQRAAAEPDRIKAFDGSLPVKEVADQILAEVRARFGLKAAGASEGDGS